MRIWTSQSLESLSRREPFRAVRGLGRSCRPIVVLSFNYSVAEKKLVPSPLLRNTLVVERCGTWQQYSKSVQTLITISGPATVRGDRPRSWPTRVLVAAALLIGLDSAAADTELTNRYIALAIQGDLRSAPALLRSEAHAATPGGADLARQFRERFQTPQSGPAPASGDTLVDAVVTAYHRYWREVLTGKTRSGTAEMALVSTLREILAHRGPDSEIDLQADVYAQVEQALQSRGFHSLLSLAPPLQDLFVWRKEAPRRYRVELTDHQREVQVVFLSEFTSLGWKDYASLGLAATTGWVEGETLYCVEWAYLPDSENFEVSYLRHEARHLADFERFPGLPADQLEYRAKLTELAFASGTLPRLLQDFSAKAAPNPDSPHALANQRLVDDLHRTLRGEAFPGNAAVWDGLNAARVSRAARELLAQDTRRLEGERAKISTGH